MIATARAIDDAMARTIAIAFYTELASGTPLRAAYEAAQGRVLAAHDTVPDAYYGHRDLGTASESASPDPGDDHGFPWSSGRGLSSSSIGAYLTPRATPSSAFPASASATCPSDRSGT